MSLDQSTLEQDFWDFFLEVLEIENANTLTLETKIIDIEEWDSLVLLSFMALSSLRYSLHLNGSEIKEASTVVELFHLVSR